MIYITPYPLTQRINPMRKLLLTTAAVAAAIGLAVAVENNYINKICFLAGKVVY
jgi:hypothetical protein